MTRCKETSFAVEAMANSHKMHILKTRCFKVCMHQTASDRRDIN